jgi:hypothetical protein
VVEVLAVRDVLARTIAHVKAAAAEEAVAEGPREGEEALDNSRLGPNTARDNHTATTTAFTAATSSSTSAASRRDPGATVRDRARLRVDLLCATFRATAASLPAVSALHTMVCTPPVRSLAAAVGGSCATLEWEAALEVLRRVYVEVLGGRTCDFQGMVTLRTRREDCGVLPGVGAVAGAIATLRTAIKVGRAPAPRHVACAYLRASTTSPTL